VKLIYLLSLGLALGAEPVSVRFNETQTVFQNPGQGWMCGPGSRTTRFPCSVVYIRFQWMEAEPEEGHFNWDVLDKPIAAARARGASIAFRVMTTSAHSRGYYCSPKWLFDAGCKSFDYEVGGDDPTSGGIRIKRIEPDYADPIYLAKHANFIRELGKRYDGNPNVEFLDIGSYGVWGEWHTKHPVAWEVRRQIIDMYLDAFKRTPLAMMSDDAQAMAYALPKGAGYRRDGVGSPSHEQTWIGSKKYKDVPGFADAWQRSPAIFEWYGDYAYMQRRQWSFDNAVKFMLNNHVTLINDNVGKLPDAQMEQLVDLARKSGYRFVLREASHASEVRPGGSLQLKMRWSNVGVSKMYRAFPLEVYLLDASGKTVATLHAAADARKWLPGDHDVVEKLEIPRGVKKGDYTLALALVDGAGKPAVALAIDAKETDRVYRISTLKIR